MNGALNTAALVALFGLMALRPWVPRRSTPFNLQFALGYLINEQPFVGLWWLLSGTIAVLLHPELGSLPWWLVSALCAVDVLVLARLAGRARSARPVLSAALSDAFGPHATPRFTQPSWWRITLLPFISWRPDVRRIRNRRYGPARRGNRLDVYVSRRHRRPDAPVIVYLHGGAFRMGSKMLGAHPLLYRLAAAGWVCISADYRLFRTPYREQLADVHAALAWTQANAGAYGGSAHRIIVAGGSSGAHLAATAALSGADVRGVVALGGYYGNAGRPSPEPTTPLAYITPDAPPFLIMHGSLDTLVLAGDAQRFADRLRERSDQPVAFAQLPGTQHNFDFFHSLRFTAVTDAVVRFGELTVGADGAGPAPSRVPGSALASRPHQPEGTP